MLEFALLAPVAGAFLIGLTSVSMTFVHTMQADQLCRKAVKMAAAGADFDKEEIRSEIYGLYGGNALQDRTAVLYVTHIGRESSGYRKIRSYELGRVNRWTSSANTPEKLITLEPGEDAWIAELWFDNDTILSTVAPKEMHSRSIL